MYTGSVPELLQNCLKLHKSRNSTELGRGKKKKGWGKEPLKSTIQSYIEQKKNIWTPKEIFLTLHMYNCRALSK